MKPLRLALRRSNAQVRHVTPVSPAAATGVVAEVYRQLERDFGMLAPPISLHSPAPTTLAASWMLLRETLIVPGRAGRLAKESTAASISAANSCPYCVDVHGSAAEVLTGTAARTRIAAPADRSGTASAAAETEMSAVALTFHYLNRMVHVFLGDSPLPPGAPAVARRLLGRIVRPRGAVVPGDSLRLLPAAPLPRDLYWAEQEHTVATALARACAAVEVAAEGTVPPSVRNLVRAELAAWDGTPPGLGRSWVEGRLAGVTPDAAPAARLALLTAMAPYQVDEAMVRQVRESGAGDRDLVELTAWAALTAARGAVRDRSRHTSRAPQRLTGPGETADSE